jgi:hypothetical protein
MARDDLVGSRQVGRAAATRRGQQQKGNEQ